MRFFLLCALAAFTWHSPSPAAERSPGADAEREANRSWLASLPAAPKPELTRHGLVAQELRRWKPRGANQGVAVDARYFYGIGNYVVGKYDKTTGERIAEWVGLRGGAITHLNSGIVQEGRLILAHSNYPQVPMASSVEFFDPATVQPVKSVSLGIRHGSLTWAEKKEGFWWACFAHYTSPGALTGTNNRFTMVGKFTDDWQLLESWLFPPQVVASWGASSCSGGSWGEDGLLYATGHDAKELHVLRLPRMGVTLDYVTTIDAPFEGQAWAWDRAEGRIIYGITRASGEVVVARIPPVPERLLAR
ncbi:MAG: hypothetical protein RIQ93_15 [Verrucomicrobiota bacterium]|jgi:hypothetical protein